MSDLPLKGQTAVVTGGGSGIGLASARLLVADGASVLLMGRNPDKLAKGASTLDDVVTDGAVVSTFPGDVTVEDDVVAAVAAAKDLPGELRLCVASAGDGTVGPIVGTSLDEWNRVIGVSLTGVFLTFKHAGAAIAESRGGAMLAVSSIAGVVTHKFMGPYNTAKAGVDMLVRTTADEMGAVGIRVNGVNPGIVRTDLVAMISEADETGQSYLTNTPIRRFGEVEDVANAIRFLVGPESSWITGVNLSIDGGHHLRCGPDYAPIARMLYSEVVDGRILD